MKLNRIFYGYFIGQDADVDGEPILCDDFSPITFSSADVYVQCGHTTNGLLSMGHNGLHTRILVQNQRRFSDKDSVLDEIDNQGINHIDFMIPVEAYLQHIFTDAVINNIYRRLGIWKGWVYEDFQMIDLEDHLLNIPTIDDLIHHLGEWNEWPAQPTTDPVMKYRAMKKEQYNGTSEN